MITYELQETRDVPGGGGRALPGPALPGRAPGRLRRPVRAAGGVEDGPGVRSVPDVRDIRSARSVRPARRSAASARAVGAVGPDRPRPAARRARPTPARTRVSGRAAALCPSPVALAPRAVVTPATYRMRRLVAGVGVALASAAVVFGLGLLADASSAAHGVPTAPVSVVDGS